MSLHLHVECGGAVAAGDPASAAGQAGCGAPCEGSNRPDWRDIRQFGLNVEITGYQFDVRNGALPHEVDEMGEHYHAGYTMSELIEISRRRDEFEPLESP